MGGLLPADVSLETRVITPTLFAPKGTWGVRRLSGDELLLAHDWPMFLIDAVGDAWGLLGFGLDKQRAPGKRQHRLEIESDTDNVRGKVKCGLLINSAPPIHDGTEERGPKRNCNDSTDNITVWIAFHKVDNSTVGGSGATPKKLQTSCCHGLTPGRDADYDAEAPSSGSKQGRDANPETEEESNNTHSKISGSEPRLAPYSDSEKGITRTNLKDASFLGGTTDDKLLKAIDRKKRERKATKSDDAEVPVYLWEEHMINDGDFGRTQQISLGCDP
eukprot:scaffold47333_cov42-Attheya_sp.AAC.3